MVAAGATGVVVAGIGVVTGAAPSIGGMVTGVIGIAVAGAVESVGAAMVADGVCVADSVLAASSALRSVDCGLNMFSAIARIKYTTNTETVPTVSASPVRPPNAVSVPPPPPKALASPPPCGRCTRMTSTNATLTKMKRKVKTVKKTLMKSNS